MLTQQVLGPIHIIDSPYHGAQGVLGSYLIKGGESMLIDPGPTSQVPGALEGLRQLHVKTLRYVGLTHIHLDHGGGAWRMIEHFPEADVYTHPRSVEHLVDPGRLAATAKNFLGEQRFAEYGEIKGVNPMKIIESRDGEILDLQGAALKVIWTPGHASHEQSFWEPDYRILIVGDSAGNFSKRSGNIFPLTPPPFNPERAIESLDRLIVLRPEIICYSHFGFAYEAVKKLAFYREEVALWSSISERGVKEGLDINGVWALLKESDPLLRLAADDNAGRMKAAVPNIIGLMDYHRWKLQSAKNEPSKTA